MRRSRIDSLIWPGSASSRAAFALTTVLPTLAAAGGGKLVTPTPTAPIYGGEIVADCGWPTTVEVDGCTGTLVHPEIVITAAHCVLTPGANTPINFGENWSASARTVTAQCQPHPEYNDGDSFGRDIAFCRLTTPVDDVPLVPVLMGCGTQALTGGQEVAVVGFGVADDSAGDGPKRQVFTTINSMADDEAFVGGGGKDSCQGDSGGPVYMPMADGSWRVFGITSYGGDCGGGGYYSLMHVGVPWIEQTSGVDITPCHDANGDWNPGPSCGQAPTAPHVGAGDWATGCAGGPSIAMAEVCEGGSVDTEPGGDGDGGGDGDAGEVGTGETDDEAGIDDAGSDDGCACSATPSGSGAHLTWLTLIALAGVRRRGPGRRR